VHPINELQPWFTNAQPFAAVVSVPARHRGMVLTEFGFVELTNRQRLVNWDALVGFEVSASQRPH